MHGSCIYTTIKFVLSGFLRRQPKNDANDSIPNDRRRLSHYLNALSKMTARPRKALVIGAGPVGALTALSLHRRGWEVEIWESREGQQSSASMDNLVLTDPPDPRGQDVSFTNLRSINLAISSRGLEALRSVDPSLGQS